MMPLQTSCAGDICSEFTNIDGLVYLYIVDNGRMGGGEGEGGGFQQ